MNVSGIPVLDMWWIILELRKYKVPYFTLVGYLEVKIKEIIIFPSWKRNGPHKILTENLNFYMIFRKSCCI